MGTEIAKRPTRPDNVTVRGARIIFRNFAGKEGPYNDAGVRSFALVLDEDTAQAMLRDGWNVKYLKAREEGDAPQAYVPVAVSYRIRPPKVALVTYRNGEPQRVNLPEDLVEMVDYADIANVDVIINPSVWGPNARGDSGIKAYLKTMIITISQDELEAELEEIPEMDLYGKPLQLGMSPHGQEPGDDDELVLEEQEDGGFA